MVITVGGLGFSQMGSVRRAIQKECPDAQVISAGFWDAYKSDIVDVIRKSPRKHLVLIGHSLGCQTIADAAGKVKKVDLLVLIEPAWDDIKVPRKVERSLWFQRTEFSIVRQARVSGASPKKIDGGHDTIPHSPELVAEVVQAINQLK